MRFAARVTRRDLIASVCDTFDGVLRSGALGVYDTEWMEYRFPYVAYTRLREMLLRDGAGTAMLDTQLPEFRATVDAIIAQLGVPQICDRPWWIIPGQPGYVGISVNGGEYYVSDVSLGQAAVDLADKLQDAEIDRTWRAVPACFPGHPHPPKAELYPDGQTWVCPQTGRAVRLITPDI